MSLGWGLRGYIGGGPLGAMIPGALVAMAICLLLRRGDPAAAVAAAFGAVGIGFGGQETYGQTVGHIVKPETFWLGLIGLSLKGAVWGLLGGAVLGYALDTGRPARKPLFVSAALMVFGTWLGWKWINDPKLIYFSNRFDKPRVELWAGLALGALLWLAYLASRGEGKVAGRFAMWGALGGGIGFGGGGCLMSAGTIYQWARGWIGWWKVMELFFGFSFGLALGLCAYSLRDRLRSSAPPPAGTAGPAWTSLAFAVLICAGTFALVWGLPVRFDYTVAGALLLCLVLFADEWAWYVALIVTATAFYADWAIYYSRTWQVGSAPVGWGVALIASLATWWAAWVRMRRQRPFLAFGFLLLLWTSTGVSCFKMCMRGWPEPAGLLQESVFVLMAGYLTWVVTRGVRSEVHRVP